jgi:hypothetical protein
VRAPKAANANGTSSMKATLWKSKKEKRKVRTSYPQGLKAADTNGTPPT